MANQDQVAAARGIAIQGAWVNAPAHTTFMLVEAPNAHAVNDFVREIQLMAWNTITVHPVASMTEAAAQALEQRD